jgi:AcrR family transcriptional regulator
MPKSNETRNRIIQTATQLLIEENTAALNIRNICATVGITKKTLYYHFESKDQLMEVVIAGIRPHYLATFEGWAAEAGPTAAAPQRIIAVFTALIREALKPGWKGCCFLRTAIELGNLPGHPARKLAAESNAALQSWLCVDLRRNEHPTPSATASRLLILINGLIITMVVHKGASFSETVLAHVSDLVAPRLKVA